jgi:hypothetical protein
MSLTNHKHKDNKHSKRKHKHHSGATATSSRHLDYVPSADLPSGQNSKGNLGDLHGVQNSKVNVNLDAAGKHHTVNEAGLEGKGHAITGVTPEGTIHSLISKGGGRHRQAAGTDASQSRHVKSYINISSSNNSGRNVGDNNADGRGDSGDTVRNRLTVKSHSSSSSSSTSRSSSRSSRSISDNSGDSREDSRGNNIRLDVKSHDSSRSSSSSSSRRSRSSGDNSWDSRDNGDGIGESSPAKNASSSSNVVNKRANKTLQTNTGTRATNTSASYRGSNNNNGGILDSLRALSVSIFFPFFIIFGILKGLEVSTKYL